jgi:CRISPR system Cascade subunit CasD
MVLRLAGPLQAWGRHSEGNRRETANAPGKSGVVGLLGAARGDRRRDPLDDLLALELGVRIDRPGTVLRDYHTVSDYRGRPLLSAAVDAKGKQRPATGKPGSNLTRVSQRFYLQDAVFVVALRGERELMSALAQAVRRPAFPLALGRRSCVPTQPLVIVNKTDGHDLWETPIVETLRTVPWLGGMPKRRSSEPLSESGVRLAAIVDADAAPEHYSEDFADLPVSFDPKRRAFQGRPVSHIWVDAPAPTGVPAEVVHGFELLGGA